MYTKLINLYTVHKIVCKNDLITTLQFFMIATITDYTNFVLNLEKLLWKVTLYHYAFTHWKGYL